MLHSHREDAKITLIRHTKNAKYELKATTTIQTACVTILRARPYNDITGTGERPACKLTYARADSSWHPRSPKIHLSEFNHEFLAFRKGANVL